MRWAVAAALTVSILGCGSSCDGATGGSPGQPAICQVEIRAVGSGGDGDAAKTFRGAGEEVERDRACERAIGEACQDAGDEPDCVTAGRYEVVSQTGI